MRCPYADSFAEAATAAAQSDKTAIVACVEGTTLACSAVAAVNCRLNSTSLSYLEASDALTNLLNDS